MFEIGYNLAFYLVLFIAVYQMVLKPKKYASMKRKETRRLAKDEKRIEKIRNTLYGKKFVVIIRTPAGNYHEFQTILTNWLLTYGAKIIALGDDAIAHVQQGNYSEIESSIYVFFAKIRYENSPPVDIYCANYQLISNNEILGTGLEEYYGGFTDPCFAITLIGNISDWLTQTNDRES